MKKLLLLIFLLLLSGQVFGQVIIKQVNESMVISESTYDSLNQLGLKKAFAGNTEIIDFNNDGYDDIVMTIHTIPKIGSITSVFIYDQLSKLFIEDSARIIFTEGEANLGWNTVFDINRDGLTDIYIPVQNYHGKEGEEPDFYINGTSNMPGQLNLNTGSGFEHRYLDSLIYDWGYPSYYSAAAIDIDGDGMKDLLVPSINQRMDNDSFLMSWYKVQDIQNVESELLFPSEYVGGQYQGSTQSIIVKQERDKYYVLHSPKLEQSDKYGASISYPEVWIYNKNLIDGQPEHISTINLVRDSLVYLHESYVHPWNFFISDLNQDGQIEFVLHMYGWNLTPNTPESHSGLHIFDSEGFEVTRQFFEGNEYLDFTGSNANGFFLEDLNSDGYDDILMRSRFIDSRNEITMYINDGEKLIRKTIPVEMNLTFRIPIDVDNDGIFEILGVKDGYPYDEESYVDGTTSLFFLNYEELFPPDSIPLLSPLNELRNVSSRPIIKWTHTKNVNSYTLQISTDGFQTFVVNESLTDTTFTTPELTYNTIYSWRVRGTNSSGDGEWSSVWSFTTHKEPLSTSTPQSPIDGQENVGTITEFNWTKVDSVQSYHLQVSTDSMFSTLSFESTEIDTNTYTLIEPLEQNSGYYWRIRSLGEIEERHSEWSQILSFTTGVRTSVEDIVPTEYSLNQNYPNPFNPVTQIKFSLPKSSHVKLEVFTILGQPVSVLVDGNLSSGVYSIEFDGSRISSGVYLYRLTTPEFTQTRVMNLLK